ncbi:MAG: inositol monophosphatase family protein, partial [Pseudorhodoplanes sp.]
GCGSALKFGLLAEGLADLYPRLAPTSEWDIAAGDAILTGAGGLVVTPDGNPVIYGGNDGHFLIPAFIAWGDAKAARTL